MSGPSTLVLCRTCGWERPYEWFLVPDFAGPALHGTSGFERVKECRACRDHWDDTTALVDDQYDTWRTQP